MPAPSPSTPSPSGLQFLGAVAGGLVHEIRNPLSTLRLNLQLMEEEIEDAAAPSEPRVQRTLDRIQTLKREVSRLEDILNDFLRYAGIRRLDLAEADLNRVIEETVTFFAPECARAKVDLAFYPDLRLPFLRLDERLLKQALMNLLLNAVQAMEGRVGSQLFVRTRLDGERVRVDVIDNGPGIPDEIRERVWDVYFSSKKAGTGLGLPTARRIVEEHGGTLTFESEAGKGTDFALVLPLRRAPSVADAAESG